MKKNDLVQVTGDEDGKFFQTFGAEHFKNKIGNIIQVHTHCGTDYATIAFGFNDGDWVFTFDICDLEVMETGK